MLAQFHPFAVALIIGFALGIERERSHPRGSNSMGVRTFPLLCLLGTLSAHVERPWMAASFAAFTIIIILISYARSTLQERDPDLGITTEVSGVVTFAVGYVIYSQTMLGIALGVALLAILLSRKWLHRFVLQSLKSRDVQAGGTLIVFWLGILPFLPKRTIDPWGLFNPHQFGLLIAVLALVQFGAYVAGRMLGAKAGLALSGFLGGFVSSTAVFTSVASTVRNGKNVERAVMTSALLALAAMLIEMLAILAVAPPLFQRLAAAGLSGTIAAIVMAAILWRRGETGSEPIPGKALDWRSVLRLAVFIIALVCLVQAGRLWVGSEAVRVIAFLSGLFELHGVTLATAALFSEGSLDLAAAAESILIALAASIAAKGAIVAVTTRGRFRLGMLAILGIFAFGVAGGEAAYRIFAV